jgi:hypothetical protein
VITASSTVTRKLGRAERCGDASELMMRGVVGAVQGIPLQ